MPNLAGASAGRSADVPVIQPASASPRAGEDENPDPLQPLATQSPGTSGTGPSTKRPSGLIVNIPPRCSAAAALPAGTSRPTRPPSRLSTARSSGTSAGGSQTSNGSGARSNPPSM